MKEVWKDVVGYEGYYLVNNFGIIKRTGKYVRAFKNSYRYLPEKIIQSTHDKDGYLKVQFSKEGKRTTARVHRVVLTAFNPCADTSKQVNHKDENKENNRLDNLEWCDAKYNLEYNGGQAKRRETQIRNLHQKNGWRVGQYDLNGNLIKVWDSITRISTETGFTRTCIRDCLSGVQKKSHGYVWKKVS